MICFSFPFMPNGFWMPARRFTKLSPTDHAILLALLIAHQKIGLSDFILSDRIPK